MQALVVEDTAAVRELLADQLARLGFEVEQAASGSEAMARLGARPDVEVVLLDWAMPEMDGLEVLRQLRADSRFGELPVVMLVTEDEVALVSQALIAGASEYLVKPFHPQSVLEKLLLLGLDPERRRAA